MLLVASDGGSNTAKPIREAGWIKPWSGSPACMARTGDNCLLIAWSVLRRPIWPKRGACRIRRSGQAFGHPREPGPYAFRAVRNAAVDLLTAQRSAAREPIEAAADPPATMAREDGEQMVEAVRQAMERLDTANGKRSNCTCRLG